jgi:hypothetical protein
MTISTRAPWITLNEQHIMACTSTIVQHKQLVTLQNYTGMRVTHIPHELDALKWKAIGR